MSPEQIEELAALHAVGALDGADRVAFERLLQGGDAHAHSALTRFQEAAAMFASESSVAARPPAALRQRILDRVQSIAPSAGSPAEAGRRPGTRIPGFRFIHDDPSAPWQPLPVPGAFVKMLSFNQDEGYAVVLGRLDAGCRYPAHFHSGAEDLYMVSGDLTIGDHVLKAGDFHHADAGTSHGENFSEHGCVLLAVICSRDVLQQMGVG